MRSLTPRQARVLARIASEIDYADIAKEEHMGLRSIERLVHEIKERLGVESIPKALLVAHSIGYISLPDENGIVHALSPFTEEE